MLAGMVRECGHPAVSSSLASGAVWPLGVGPLFPPGAPPLSAPAPSPPRGVRRGEVEAAVSRRRPVSEGAKEEEEVKRGRVGLSGGVGVRKKAEVVGTHKARNPPSSRWSPTFGAKLGFTLCGTPRGDGGFPRALGAPTAPLVTLPRSWGRRRDHGNTLAQRCFCKLTNSIDRNATEYKYWNIDLRTR